jgi:GLPGLI family protein
MRLLFCLFFFSVLVRSQSSENKSYHAIYLASWTFDKGDPSPAQEYVALSVNDNASIFQKHNTRKLDSIRVKREPTVDEINNLTNLERYAIEFNGNILTYYHTIGETEYQYKETLDHDWKLGTASTTIKGYSCRDATVSYGGRNWKAWYAPSVPLNVGPYKFRGLPGLIIKITDSTGDYDYEIYSLNKRKDVRLTKFFHDKTAENLVTTNRIAYNKVRLKWNELSFNERMEAMKSQTQHKLTFKSATGEPMDDNTARNRRRAKEIGFIEID